MQNFIANLVTTNFRIFVSVILAAIWAITGIIGALHGTFDAVNAAEFDHIGIAISVWLGIDVTQFLSKRLTYQAPAPDITVVTPQEKTP